MGLEAYADRRRDAVSWDMATDMDAVATVLRRVADGDDAVLADPETFSDFKQAVSRLQVTAPFSGRGVPARRDPTCRIAAGGVHT